MHRKPLVEKIGLAGVIAKVPARTAFSALAHERWLTARFETLNGFPGVVLRTYRWTPRHGTNATLAVRAPVAGAVATSAATAVADSNDQRGALTPVR